MRAVAGVFDYTKSGARKFAAYAIQLTWFSAGIARAMDDYRRYCQMGEPATKQIMMVIGSGGSYLSPCTSFSSQKLTPIRLAVFPSHGSGGAVTERFRSGNHGPEKIPGAFACVIVKRLQDYSGAALRRG